MSSNPWQDAGYRVERARRLLRRRRPVEALEELRAAAEMEPHHAIHHYELGRCLGLLGRLDESANAFARAAEVEPTEPAYAFSHGEARIALRQWADALTAFEKASELDPTDDLALVRQLEAQAELGAHEKAEELFYRAVQLRDDRPASYYHVGRSLHARGLTSRALWCWKKVGELTVNGVDTGLATQALVRTAEAHASLGQTDDARRIYLQVLARDAQHFEALLGLASLLVDARRYDAARDRITRAVRLEPDDPRGHFLAGRRYLAVGRYVEASVALRRVVELSPSFSRGHLMLARLAIRQDDPVAVRRHCRAEMMRRPDDVGTLEELADMLLDVADTSRAVACLKRLVAIAPSDARAWQNLGVAECWHGNTMAGVIASRRALRLDPTNLVAANNLALALLELREIDAAAKVVADGLRVDPSHRLLRRVRLRLR
ncbi:MAG: tetratricopeptide repeat protein, partial [Planctomycetota bacterium]